MRSTSLGGDRDVLAGLRAADDLVGRRACRPCRSGVLACAMRLLLLLRRVEVDDLVGDLAVLDDAVGRRDEAVLGDLRVARERADEADVRPLRRLDRAHAAVVGRVDVADLDGRALAGQAAGAERREAAAVGQAGQRVRLVHELRELRGAEELLQRGHDRADVHDRLRRDRVLVLGRQALADDALHPVEADAEGLLDELADGAQAPVAEVLVLVEVIGDRLARHRHGLGGVVLDLDLAVLGDAEELGQGDELLDQRVDVVVRQRARVEVDVEPEARVQLVAADAREVVALGVEEQLLQQRVGGVDARRLARALLLEELDERALLRARVARCPPRSCCGGRASCRRARAAPGRGARRPRGSPHARVGLRVVGHRAQQDRDRQLALAVDADEDPALLVDLELEPRAAGRHEVRREDLLLAVLGLHDVGARRADELRDDDALGAVDDERAALGHPREVAHEDRLLADLARLVVDEGDGDGQRARVGEVLLAALLDRRGGLVEVELAELARPDGRCSPRSARCRRSSRAGRRARGRRASRTTVAGCR